MSNRERIQYGLTLMTDLAALVCSVATAFLVFGLGLHLILDIYTRQDYVQFYLVLAVAFFAAFAFFTQSDNIARRTPRDELNLCVKFNAVFAALLAVFLLITKATLLESRYLFVGVPVFNAVYMQLFHALLKARLNRLGAHPKMAKLVGILTTRERAPALIDDLRKDWTKNLHGVALLGSTSEEIGGTINGVLVRAAFDDFLDWVRCDALDEVYLDVPYDTGDSMLPYLRELESMGLDIHLNIPILEHLYSEEENGAWTPHLNRTLEEFGRSSMITLSATRRTLRDAVLKRLMDIAGSVVGLLISVPIIAVVAIPLKLESPGPLFFRQKRVGLNGRYFYIYKLRSMYVDAEERKKELMAQNEIDGLMFKITDDPRITRVGRFIRRTSIDELPQFFNVLRGDMSLVGTRPPTVDEYERYESHHKRRLSMKPGITGMWQVSGRSNIENFEEVVRLDVAYIDNWSLWLDIKIIFKTIMVVFGGHGAK